MSKVFIESDKVERTLFPEQHQFIIGRIKGQSYLSSLWIGFTAPLINLPLMLWRGVIIPPFVGLFFIAQFFVLGALAGLLGRAHGFTVDIPKVIIKVTNESED
jgi:hypothetical protein